MVGRQRVGLESSSSSFGGELPSWTTYTHCDPTYGLGEGRLLRIHTT